jgi:hypothetical protein
MFICATAAIIAIRTVRTWIVFCTISARIAFSLKNYKKILGKFCYCCKRSGSGSMLVYTTSAIVAIGASGARRVSSAISASVAFYCRGSRNRRRSSYWRWFSNGRRQLFCNFFGILFGFRSFVMFV